MPARKLPQTVSTGRAASHNPRQHRPPTGPMRTELGRQCEFGTPHYLTRKRVDLLRQDRNDYAHSRNRPP